ncbi:siderophore-iron reductase FhuF [Methylobacterium sp. J-068]|uniref:siderophore-iron reductase FhuF n=1 Tax=Methylobacterium sp. J-068 TaxID=2836649 RepID=UPI001FB8C990|nr:siderophore-iron reductase FhuF [Methylobacterium sp. J-068]MCJ2036120.1 siderophore-iron reductase FhuF [Methylobacterium sp. J-068]
MSLDALAPLFSGPLSAYEGRLVPFADARPGLSGTALLEPATLSAHLARFARTYPDVAPDPRAVASIWSKHHFAALVVPTLAASLILGRTLPVALDAIAVVSDAEGRTLALKLRDAGAPAPGPERFAPLIEGHIRPLAAALAAVSGLAPRVIWGNAGNVLDAILNKAELAAACDPSGLAAARDLIRHRCGPDGRPNPLFDAVRYVGPEAATRQRKVCCLRYLIPAQTLCAACPLPARPA